MQTEVYFCLRLIRIFDFVEDTLVRQCSNKFDIALAYSHLWLHREMLLLGKTQTAFAFARAYPYLCRSMNRMIDIFSVLGHRLAAFGKTPDTVEVVRRAAVENPWFLPQEIIRAVKGYSLRDARTATARSVGGRISSGADAEAGIGGYGRQYSAGRFFRSVVRARERACVQGQTFE